MKTIISLFFAAVLLAASTVAVAHRGGVFHSDFRQYPLHHAVEHNDIAEIKRLLASGVHVDVENDIGRTALLDAATENAKESAALLLNYGANINVKTDGGATALHLAVLNNAKETAEVLLVYGANVNAKEDDGDTPLHYAAGGISKETAEVLLAYGANINAKTDGGGTCKMRRVIPCDSKWNDGGTALHVAALNNAKETAEVLLANGANIAAKRDDGRTALRLAVEFDNKETAEMLSNYTPGQFIHLKIPLKPEVKEKSWLRQLVDYWDSL